MAQTKNAGQLMKAEGYDFDVAYTSMLKRATHTLWHALDAMDRTWLPVVHSWRLNERHYGGLRRLERGGNRSQVWRYRKCWPGAAAMTSPHHPLDAADKRSERGDLRYARLQPEQVPLTECLKDTVARVLPFWNESMAPAIKAGKRIVVAAHGNSIRALVKHLDNISDDEIVGVNIPNGIPLVYELDGDLKPLAPLLPRQCRGRSTSSRGSRRPRQGRRHQLNPLCVNGA